MKYRIERMEGQHCHFVNGRTELSRRRRGRLRTSARFTKTASPIP